MTRLTERNIEVIDDVSTEMFRAMSGPERRAVAGRMYCSARRRIRFFLQKTEPEWDDMQITIETARRLSHGAIGPNIRT